MVRKRAGVPIIMGPIPNHRTDVPSVQLQTWIYPENFGIAKRGTKAKSKNYMETRNKCCADIKAQIK